jgi:oligoendopeptidase F
VLHRYLKLRQKLLGIAGKFALYDMYAPLPERISMPSFAIGDSERLTLAATSVYGPEFTAALERGFSNRWMDALPRPGKLQSAYMMGGAYDVHPYLLLNHGGDYVSLSAFVHEWTQAIHAALANRTQPYENANFSVFAAQTAANTSEMLLIDYLAAHAQSKDERLLYLYQGLEELRSDFFRQSMYAEFQLAIHDEAERGRELSGKRFSEIYCNLLRRYYGADTGATEIDPGYCVEWASIPYFYYGFYAYQYPIGLAGAASMAEDFRRSPSETRERFIAMLKSGGSDYPARILKNAGVELDKAAPYQALFARMSRMMDEIESLQ